MKIDKSRHEADVMTESKRRRTIFRSFNRSSGLSSTVHWASKANSVAWRANFHSVYVRNIPVEASLSDIWKLFSKFGVVADILIPSKVERLLAGKGVYAKSFKYSFVRYRKKQEASNALSAKSVFLRGNSLVIRNAKIVSSKDKEKAHVLQNGYDFHCPGKKSCMGVLPSKNSSVLPVKVDGSVGPLLKDNFDEENLEEERVKTVYEKRKESIGFQSRKYITQEKSRLPMEQGPESNIQEFEVHIPVDDMLWIKRSGVGQLRTLVTCQGAEDALRRQGIGVYVTPLSNSQALITFLDEEEKGQFLDQQHPEFKIWFESIFHTVPKDFQRKKRIWVRIDGLPLQLWHKHFFSFLGDLWGMLVWIADVTLKKKILEAAWLELEVDTPVSIPDTFSASVNGSLCKLQISMVREEVIPRDLHFEAQSSSSSEEISERSPAFLLEPIGDDILGMETVEPLDIDGSRDGVRSISGEALCDGYVMCDGEETNLNSNSVVVDRNSGDNLDFSYGPNFINRELMAQQVVDHQIAYIGGSVVMDACAKVTGPREDGLLSAKDENFCGNADVGALVVWQRPNDGPMETQINVDGVKGDLIVDLREGVVRDVSVIDDVFISDSHLDIQPPYLIRNQKDCEGFGGLSKGFLVSSHPLNWSWIKRPRPSKVNQLSECATRKENLEETNNRVPRDYESLLRKEAEESLKVGKMLGLSFRETDEEIVNALMVIDSNIADVC